VGDVAELRTRRGLSYAQMVHKHETHGALIRLIEGAWDERPADLANVVANGQDQFLTFFPLGSAVNRSLLDIVGNFPVPKRHRKLPVFRNAGLGIAEGHQDDWWLWDGQREWRIGALKAKHKALPLAQVITWPVLTDRIESGWHATDDV
jgi:hypothetical protein